MSNNNNNYQNNNHNNNNHHHNYITPSYTTPATPPNNPPNALNFDPNFTHYNYYPQSQLQQQQQPTPQRQMGQPPPSSSSPTSPQQRRSSRFFGRSTTTTNTPPLDKTNSENYTYIRNDNGTINVYQQPSKTHKYNLITPSSNNPHVSIISKQTSDILWDAKVLSSEGNSGPNGPKITPTANWECVNNVVKNNSNNSLNSQDKSKKNYLRPQRTLIKYNKQVKGYACTWNGRVFLWKLYGNGGNIYCTEGLSELGRKVAEFDDKSNTVTIDLNGRLNIGEVLKANNNDNDNNNDNNGNNNSNNNNNSNTNHPYQLSSTSTMEKLGVSLSQKSLSQKSLSQKSLSINDELRDAAETESFESFILLTGLIAKNAAKKLQNTVKRMSSYGDNSYLFNYTPFFVCCGILQFT